MITPPDSFLTQLIYFLQAGSASIAGTPSDLFGVPV
jgi:hypothetical protein